MIFQDFLIISRDDVLYLSLVGLFEIVDLVDIVELSFLELGVKALGQQF